MAERGILAREDGATISYERMAGRTPAIVFAHGLRSDMGGTKPTALAEHCARVGRAFVRYDAYGHGGSSGAFPDGTIGRWRDDLLAVIDGLTEGPVIVVGSSMGGWVMLLAALARPERIAGLIGIAAAPDFTEALMWKGFTSEQREAIERDGRLEIPSEYGEPMIISRALIEDGRTHLLMGGSLAIHAPVRLLQGQADPDVPWCTALNIAKRIEGPDVRVTLVKHGDHRLSQPDEIALLLATVEELAGKVSG